MDASPVDEKTELDGLRGLFQLWWVKTRFTATQASHMNSSCSGALLRSSRCWANMSVCLIPQWMSRIGPWLGSVQFSHSVMPDPLWPHGLQHARFPVHHQLPELTQTHVHWVGDAIQPSHPLSSPSPPTFNLFQHQDLFKWVSSSHQVAKILEFQLQYQSFQWIFRTDFL